MSSNEMITTIAITSIIMIGIVELSKQGTDISINKDGDKLDFSTNNSNRIE